MISNCTRNLAQIVLHTHHAMQIIFKCMCPPFVFARYQGLRRSLCKHLMWSLTLGQCGQLKLACKTFTFFFFWWWLEVVDFDCQFEFIDNDLNGDWVFFVYESCTLWTRSPLHNELHPQARNSHIMHLYNMSHPWDRSHNMSEYRSHPQTRHCNVPNDYPPLQKNSATSNRLKTFVSLDVT